MVENSNLLIDPPTNAWFMETGSIYLWLVLFGWHLSRTWHTRQLSFFALFFFAATLTFWQEFYADWGNYQIWNPHFDRLPFWPEDSPYTTPVKPLWMPFSWGWYLGLVIPLLYYLTKWIHGKFTTVPVWVIATPVGLLLWIYNIYTEVNATANGLWNVTRIWGPAYVSERGSYALLYPPILLGFFAVAMILMLYRKDAEGFFWHERVFRANKTQPGLKREILRFVSFLMLFNVLFIVFQTGPIMLFRILVGGPSDIVP